jgi:hypothetical protein
MSLARALLLLTILCSVTATSAQAPPPRPGEPELHVVGLYEGANRMRGDPQTSKALVHVDRPGKQVTLIVGAYHSVTWNVIVSEGTQLAKIILAGYEKQTVNELPKNVEVVDAFSQGRQGQMALPYVYSAQSAAFRSAIRQIRGVTNLEVASFQGTYRYDPQRPFVVDRVLGDPQLHSDFPKVEAAANLPRLEFQALHFLPGRLPGLGQASYGRFTLTGGPDVNGLRPLPQRVNRLTTDPASKKNYALNAHGVFEIDLNTNALTQMEMGAEVPGLSWPCGIAFDTKRQRLVVASFGGAGHLYAYTPTMRKWTTIADLNNVDLVVLAYHAKDDALYGLSVGRDGNGEGGLPILLHRYNESGATVSTTPLTGPLFPGLISQRPSASPAQLVSAGDHLVLIATTEPDRDGGGIGSESFIYLVEPKTGRVRLAWKQ